MTDRCETTREYSAAVNEMKSPATPNVLSSTMCIDHGVCTNIGQRTENQDHVLVASGSRGHLFAVADGMGGHTGGALASRLACDQVNDAFVSEPDENEEDVPDGVGRHLVESVIRADRFIRWHGRRYGTSPDMGTTLSCLQIAGGYGVIAHVGDSRIYRLRNGRLSRLTVDHTFVQDMIFEGELTASQALHHPLRHVLTRVVGTPEPLEMADSRIDKVKTGDRFLLCTDGLTDVLDESLVLEELEGSPSAALMASGLVDRSLRCGARDNVTAVVVVIH